MEHSEFGDDLGKDRDLRRQVESITEGLSTEADKVEAIYDFVRTAMTWDGTAGWLLTQDLDDALAAGVAVEARPGPVRLETDFATYEATVDPDGSTLVYRRRLTWRQPTIPAEQYPAVRSFLRQVAWADAAQAVLVKSPSASPSGRR